MFSGFFVPYTSGKHWFRTYSDDASYVYLQGINNGDERSHGGWGTRVVDNGGLHGGRWRQGGHYNLTAGQFYPITIMFGENAGAFRMIYQYHGPPGSPYGSWRDNLIDYDLHRSYRLYHGINLDVKIASKARLEGYCMYPRTNHWGANSRGGRMPGSWKVYGSNNWNDPTSWELIDTKEGIPLTDFYSQNRNQHIWGMYKVPKDQWKLQGDGYQYIRFTVSSLGKGHSCNIQHFQLYGTFEPDSLGDIVQLTGSGKPIYTHQASSNHSSGWSSYKAFDNNANTGWHDRSPYEYRPSVGYWYNESQANLGANYNSKRYWTEEVDAGGEELQISIMVNG